MKKSHDTPAPVTIRRLQRPEEYHAAEDAQRIMWGMPDHRDAVPTHLLMTQQKNGGLVLGAFDGEGAIVGYLFGYLAQTKDGKLRHYSQQMGVHPAWRSQGIGYLLKRAQRGYVLRQGLDQVTWTYDPLEAVNARLNLGKLGAICRTYVRDFYGPMQDGLNAGLPTDRFQMEWWIRSERVRAWLAAGGELRSPAEALEAGAVRVNTAEPGPGGLPVPGGWTGVPAAGRVLVEVPSSIQAVKRHSLDLASAWRFHTREIFEACFAAGYAAVDFLNEEGAGGRRSYYLLECGRDDEWTGAGDARQSASPPDLPAALARGVALFNAGQFWRCHEVLEASWRQTSDATERLFLQAIIQASAGFHKATIQANRNGLARHLRRALDKLGAFPADYAGLDVPSLRAALAHSLAAAERGDPHIPISPITLRTDS